MVDWTSVDKKSQQEDHLGHGGEERSHLADGKWHTGTESIQKQKGNVYLTSCSKSDGLENKKKASAANTTSLVQVIERHSSAKRSRLVEWGPRKAAYHGSAQAGGEKRKEQVAKDLENKRREVPPTWLVSHKSLSGIERH